jgi:hypothetical protein
MESNLDRYKKDLAALIAKGDQLHMALQVTCNGDTFVPLLSKNLGREKTDALIKSLPVFVADFQPWYTEVKVLVRQLLPDRLHDLVRLYEKPRVRKAITFENYTLEDCLQGLTITRGPHNEKIVGPEAAIPALFQQIGILKSVQARFESSLFEIRQLVQGDLFNSELDAAKGGGRGQPDLRNVVFARRFLDTHGE